MGGRGITVETAILLGARFDTSVEYWMNLQRMYDVSKLYHEDAQLYERVKSIKLLAKKMELA